MRPNCPGSLPSLPPRNAWLHVAEDAERPTEFSTKNGGFDRRLIVLKRDKK